MRRRVAFSAMRRARELHVSRVAMCTRQFHLMYTLQPPRNRQINVVFDYSKNSLKKIFKKNFLLVDRGIN